MKKQMLFIVSCFSFLVPTLAVGMLIFIFSISSCYGQPLSQKEKFTHADTLRGTITPERAWWDVTRYAISVTPDFSAKTISGITTISFRKLKEGKTMQIDLQQPMVIDSIHLRKVKRSDPSTQKDMAHITRQSLKYRQEGNAWFVDYKPIASEGEESLEIFFHGNPRVAITPPWDGGWIFTKDKKGRPWMSVAVQGLGASAWYPCKDHQSDEPDNGASLTMNVPDTLVAVANGRMKGRIVNNGIASYTWEVKNPINNYNIVPYIGKYVNFSDTLKGEKGTLDLNYWVMDYNLEKAQKQFEQVKPMLRAFEYWFGAYPFYEDGYKLVEAPHLGMEHQSAVAYGNQFKNGYLGRDLSGSGHGLKWDYIIVHESGHEWFGNNITTKDIADMWVHEGFTDYSETLFTEYYYGRNAGNEYVQGLRKNIQNDMTIIGHYGVNQEGSGDMYYKGANLLHTIRQVIDNDEKFRAILRGLNKDFYHKTVTSDEVEKYISTKSGKDFSKVFQQYLRTTKIPELELKTDNDKFKFKWKNTVPGFAMPVKLSNGQWIYPTEKEQKVSVNDGKNLTVDKNFYIMVK